MSHRFEILKKALSDTPVPPIGKGFLNWFHSGFFEPWSHLVNQPTVPLVLSRTFVIKDEVGGVGDGFGVAQCIMLRYGIGYLRTSVIMEKPAIFWFHRGSSILGPDQIYFWSKCSVQNWYTDQNKHTPLLVEKAMISWLEPTEPSEAQNLLFHFNHQHVTWDVLPMHFHIPVYLRAAPHEILVCPACLARNWSLFLTKTFLWFVTLVSRAKLGPQLLHMVSSLCVNIHFKWYVAST